MNALRKEILSCMKHCQRGPDASVSARFIFPPGFVGFQGHFPDKPVVPGVCLVQAALLLLEEYFCVPVSLMEIANAKFFAPATCDEELLVACRIELAQDSCARAKAEVTHDGKKIAQLDLRVSHASKDTNA